jgi:hypothetical protein
LAGNKKGEVPMENKEEVKLKKPGRRPKNQKVEYVINRDKCKFIVDVTGEKESADLIFGLLEKANHKVLGREINFADLALYGLAQLTEKDIVKIQESSLSEMEKVERALLEFNTKHGLNLTMGEYLVKKLNIN